MEDEVKQFYKWQCQGQSPERLLENFAARIHLSEHDRQVIKMLFRYVRYQQEQQVTKE